MSSAVQDLSVAIERGSPPTVRFSGQADFHNRYQVQEVFDLLLADGHATILADLQELRYIDSSGLSALVKCAMDAAQAGGSIELIGASTQVSRALTLCGAAVFFGSQIDEVPICRDSQRESDLANYWHVSSFSLPAFPEAASLARGRIAQILQSLPMSSPDGEDVLFALGEALANAIKHGCACNSEHRISVKCVAGPGRLAIDVTDPGCGFNPDAVPVPVPVPEHQPEGGMGIYIMRQLMDEVSFSFDKSTTVRLVKHIGAQPDSTS